MRNWKKLSLALAIAGLAFATLLVGWYGFRRIIDAMLSAGADGFALFCVLQILVVGILGLAWYVIAPAKDGGRLAVFVWGRLVRDAAACCLPFSPVGGFVLGARAVTLHGITWSIASLSTVVDLTAEFLSEIAFAAVGLLILLDRYPDGSMTAPVAAGLGVALIAGAVVIWLQRGVAPLFARLGRRLLGDWLDGGSAGAAQSQAELATLYGDTRRLALGTAIHMLGWFGKGVGNWFAFWLLGADISLAGALAIEGLLHIILVSAVLVPGYAGVQEAAYVGLGALFGVPPEVSLGVSLLRRARDIAIGIPVLLVWQLFEARRLRAMPPA
ncbi:MAG: lysylphosphatidylglycerol synthase domain-containing protein [Alphaproteobacteria bacterium]